MLRKVHTPLDFSICEIEFLQYLFNFRLINKHPWQNAGKDPAYRQFSPNVDFHVTFFHLRTRNDQIWENK